MTKLPYGFDPKRPYFTDDGLHKGTTEEVAWAKLRDVQSCLENRELPPIELSYWLGEAIRLSEGDASEFVQRLGLKLRSGERHTAYNRDFKAYWQDRLWYLGTYKEADQSTDAVVRAVLDEMTAAGIAEVPERATLQDWFNEVMTGAERARSSRKRVE